MSKLQLILLGHFDCLLSSGERISLAMRKAEVLLAYLALAPGIRHPRERLINLLWSDRGEEQARNSLRQCLSAIRKSLGNSADLILQIDRTTVSLKLDLVDVDALEFERLATEADFESLSTAAGLYQGEFLEGVSLRDAVGQEWLDSTRSRFKRQYIEILTNLGHTLLASRDYSAAIKSGEHLVEQDPLGESGWRLLMRSYFEHGDRSHALQAFKRCQQALRDELDVDPESTTIELRNQIAAGERSPAAEPTPGAGISSIDAQAITTHSIEEPSLDPQTSTDHSIVVLPFDNLSGDPEQEYFSDGITDSIILNLSLFPGLHVKSRNSSFAFKQQIKNLGEISQELEVDYVVEGSIRKSRDRIRITVQLIEAASGNQVWGKRYDAEIENLFDLEEELSRAIAATVTGQIESDLQRIAIAKGAAGQQSYDLLLSGTYHALRFNREDTVIAIDKLNQCLELDPHNVRAHVRLYISHLMGYLERWTLDHQASFKLAEEHIRKALALGPELGLVQVFYGQFLTFRGELDQAAHHFDKALEINPNDPDALTTRAFNLAMQAKAEASLQASERACQLDPYHPWAEWELAVPPFLSGHYETVLETIAKFRASPVFIQIFGVASNVKLGHIDVAQQALQVLLQECRASMLSMPQTLDEWLGYTLENYPFKDSRINQDIIDCLVQAGLCDEPTEASRDMPSIAVLPFENMSGDPEQEYFSDGITTDIISTLSKFIHMRIVARHSTLQYKNQKASIAEIAEQQGVRYILEGSVRKSGNRIRVIAELIDSQSEQICWSERYDRDLDDLFAVQDEITKNITLAMKVRFDDGEMAWQRSAGTTSIKAWELALGAADLQDTYIRQNIFDARSMAKDAIKLDPDYAFAWVILSWTHWQEAYTGWSDSMEDPIREAEKANQKALFLDSEYAETWSQAGIIHVMKHQANKAIEACRKAVDMEPGNAEINALMAFAYVFNEDYEQAQRHNQIVIKLCPVRANWYFLAGGQIEKIAGNLDAAADIYQQGIDVEPDSPLCRFFLIDVMLDKGDEIKARQLAGEIRALDKTVRGRGLVRDYSKNKVIRDRFQANLEKFDLF